VEAKLVVVGGEAQPRQYDLQLPMIIGRSRHTDLMLGHPLVSRQHCEVFEANGMLMVRDLGSLNGTFVGDKRLAEQAMPVKPGDLLTVGPVTFRAVYHAEGVKRGGSASWNAEGRTIEGPPPGLSDSARGPMKPPKRGRNGDDDDTAPPRKR
jgi:hypothetical protein